MNLHYTLRGFPITGEHYRPFCGPWWKHYFNPMTYIKGVKYFCQRGWRGYASCDHWDMDSYSEAILLGMLKDLRQCSHGFPANLVLDSDDANSPDFRDNGLERWHKILDEIILGLESSIELRQENTIPDGVYSKKPLVFIPVEGNPELLQLEDSDEPRFNGELYDAWKAPLEKQKRRGLLLLVKHWGSFWD